MNVKLKVRSFYCLCTKYQTSPILKSFVFTTYISGISISVCVPYSEQACRDVANALGLSLGGVGYSFAGDFSQKGCYAYSSGTYTGKAYYGTGGTTEEMKKSLNGQAHRLSGYDCEGI